MAEKQKNELPYQADVSVLEKMLSDLKTTNEEGINLATLWADINEANNQNRSYTLTLGKFVGLFDSDGLKIWLTKFGRSIGYMDKTAKEVALAKNLPPAYLTMIKWIKHAPSSQMTSNQLKVNFTNTFGSIGSPVVLDRAIVTFLKYTEWVGLLAYTGKGKAAKATLTETGKRILDGSINALQNDSENNSVIIHKQQAAPQAQLPEEIITSAPSVVRILAKVNDVKVHPLEIDLQTEADWTLITSYIDSLKQRWKPKT